MQEMTDSKGRAARVILYARASSEKQKDKNLSVSAQVRAMRGFARQQGWTVARVIEDDGFSGRDRSRPGLAKALAILESDEIDMLVVWKLDRLARDTVLSAAIRVRLQKAGVSVYSLHEPIGSSPQEQLMARIFEDIAEFYSANLAQDIKRGIREVTKRGFYPFSTAPVGYQRVAAQEGKATRYKLEPDPMLAPILRRIFEEYAHGRTATEIVQVLNSAGLPAGRARRWTTKRLYYLLKNQAYCGDTVLKNSSTDSSKWEVFPDTHKPLVDRDEFERVQEILKSRGQNHAIRRWETSSYLLSGLAVCGICGSPLTGESAKSGKNLYYTCGRYHQEGTDACEGVRIPKRHLEDFVLRQARAAILDDANLREVARLVSQELSFLRSETDSRLLEIDRALSEKRRKLERLYDALEDGALDVEELAPRIRERREEMAEIEKYAVQVKEEAGNAHLLEVSLEQVLGYAARLRETLRIGTRAERKRFLSGLIQSIVVTRGEVEIEYRLPSPDKTETEDLVSPVLESILSGGGGGSRTRVRNTFQSASTSLVPYFDLNPPCPYGQGQTNRSSCVSPRGRKHSLAAVPLCRRQDKTHGQSLIGRPCLV